MQAQDFLIEQYKKIAAQSHGQLPNVRTFMGRQLLFMKNSTQMFMLPAIDSVEVQINDPDNPDFGAFYHVIDLDPVDGGNPIQ